MAHLPVARTKTIMMTTDGADSITKEAVWIMTRATELFIKELAQAGAKDVGDLKTLNYSNLVNVVHSNNKYEFLEYMIPKKITVAEYKEMMRKKAEGISESSEDVSTSTSDSESGSEDTKSES